MALPPQPIGASDSFMSLMDSVSDLAALERPVLIAGERGTGKALIASRLHFLSPRWERDYVGVNCAAFAPEDLDRELFGQTFLDGRADTNGRFFEADGGTLFLDAIELMPTHLQEKLMHTIEYGQVSATGELYVEDIDVRVVAATSIDLPSAVAAGEFRADLLDRLAFHVITIPPLRARRADIEPLVESFGRAAVRSLGADRFPGFTAEVEEQLALHPFPGNVRELKLLVERSVVEAFLRDEALSLPIDQLVLDPFASPYRLTDAPVTTRVAPAATHTARQPANMRQPAKAPEPEGEQAPAGASFTDRVMAFERRLVVEAMRTHADHQGRAAEALGLTYHQMRGLLRKHGFKK